jgi:hypothetical protein
MMSPSVSPVARNVGVSPPPDGNSAVGPFEGSSVQQDPDSRGRRADQLPRYFLGDQHEGSPYQVFPNDSGIRRPDPMQRRRPRHAVGGPRDEDRPCGPMWLQVTVFLFLTVNSGMAMYLSWGDAGDISFVVSTYINLLGLSFLIMRFQAAPPNSKRREQLKVYVWMPAVSLAIAFAYQTIGSTAKPTLQLTLLLWAIPAGTGISVFIIFCGR